MVQLGEQRDFLQHLALCRVAIVYNDLLYGVDAAIEAMLDAVHLPKPSFADDLQLLEVARVSSA